MKRNVRFFQFLLVTLSSLLAIAIGPTWAQAQTQSPGHPLPTGNYVAQPGQFDEKNFYLGIQHVSPQEIHRLLPGTEGKPVFLEFKSKFCLACKKMDPILETLLPKYPAIEKRVFDMMKDRVPHKDVFDAFKPSVVPIQLYINQNGDIINAYYDYHNEADLTAGLSCIDANGDGSGCKTLKAMEAKSSQGFMGGIEKSIQGTIATGSFLTLLFSFLAGVASSFFPCTVAMLPVLVGYVGGYSNGSKRDVFLQVGIFILGLATVMTVLGIALSLLGKTFGSQNSSFLYAGVGLLCVVMGLQSLEVIHIPLPQTIKSLPETKQGKLTTFYVLGCAFGLVASPCGTPVLAAILGIISKQGNLLLGGASLFAYAVGQGMLLLVAGLFTGLLKFKGTFMAVGSKLTQISGVIIVLVGVVFLLQAIGVWTPILEALHLRNFIQ